MVFYAVLTAAIFVGLYLTDMLMGKILKMLAYCYPSDFAGPDGWLVDTRARKGVFD